MRKYPKTINDELKRTTKIQDATGEREKREYNRTGLYRQIDESQLDGRTTTAKLIRELKRELQEYIGQSAIASEMLINRRIYKRRRSEEMATFLNEKNISR